MNLKHYVGLNGFNALLESHCQLVEQLKELELRIAAMEEIFILHGLPLPPEPANDALQPSAGWTVTLTTCAGTDNAAYHHSEEG